MVPGGGIDTRDFSHIAPLVLTGFNVFLTALGMISIFLPYFILKNQRWGLVAAMVCGWGYFLVYILDFAGIFPKSPDAMPRLLAILEALGIVLSILLLLLSDKELKHTSATTGRLRWTKPMSWLLAVALVIGVAIIVFATRSAMTGP